MPLDPIQKLEEILTVIRPGKKTPTYSSDSSGELDVSRVLSGSYGNQIWRHDVKSQIKSKKKIIITDWSLYSAIFTPSGFFSHEYTIVHLKTVFCQKNINESSHIPTCIEDYDDNLDKFCRQINETVEICFWDFLFANYEVFSWDGSKDALDRPLRTSMDFDEKIKSISEIPPSSAACIAQLTEWGIPPHDFEIFDNSYVVKHCTNLLKIGRSGHFKHSTTLANYYYTSKQITVSKKNILSTIQYSFSPEEIRRIALLNLVLSPEINIEEIKQLFLKFTEVEMLRIDFSGKNRIIGIFEASQNLSKLKKVSLLCNPCSILPVLPESWKNLEQIEIYEFPLLTDISTITKCSNLKEITLIDCFSLSTLPDLHELTQLKVVTLAFLSRLINIDGLAQCHDLQEVRILFTGGIVNFNLLPEKLKKICMSFGTPNTAPTSFIDKLDTETFTRSDTTLSAKQLFYSKDQEFNMDSYRIAVYNNIVLLENKLLFTTSKEFSTNNEPQLKIADNINPNEIPDHCYFAAITLVFNDNNWAVLPSMTPRDLLLTICSDSKLEFIYDENTSQYYARLVDGDSNAVPLKYVMMLGGRQSSGSLSTIVQKHLPTPIAEALNHFASSKIPEVGAFVTLCELIGKAQTREEKITLLRNYCKDFKNEPLDVSMKSNLLKLHPARDLLAIIFQRKGVCRHRCWAFLTLSQYFHIPFCRIVTNQLHAFIEYKNYDGIVPEPGSCWENLDLGGAEVKVAIIPFNLPYSETASPPQLTEVQAPAEESPAFAAKSNTLTASRYISRPEVKTEFLTSLTPVLHAKQLFYSLDKDLGDPSFVKRYRIRIENTIVLGGRTLFTHNEIFPQGKDPQLQIVKNIEPTKIPKNCYFAEVSLEFSNNIWVAIPSIEPKDFMLAVCGDNNLEFTYDENTSQYYARSTDTNPKNVTLKYIMMRNGRRDSTNLQNSLPEPIVRALKYFEPEASPEAREFIMLCNGIGKAQTREGKIALLKKYCEEMKNEPLTVSAVIEFAPPTSYLAKNLLAKILQCKGNYQDRCCAFLTLSQYFHIPFCRIVTNELHTFIEYRNHDGIVPESGRDWENLDLGEAEEEVAVVPLNIPSVLPQPLTEVQSTIEIEPEPPAIQSEKTSPQPIVNAVEFVQGIDPELASQLTALHRAKFDLLQAKNVEQFKNLVSKECSILIRLPKADLALAIHKIFPQAFYINEADDLILLEEAKINDGEIERRNNPLALLLEKIDAAGTLIINWSNFTLQEMGTYKSLLDKPPTLHGQKISPQINIIGLLEQDIQPSEAFLSRWQMNIPIPTQVIQDMQVELAPSKQLTCNINESEIDRNAMEVVNLYNGAICWQDSLLGSIYVEENGTYAFKHGFLYYAIKKTKLLCVLNPPNNEEWKHFCVELQNKGVVRINGERLQIPENFTIYCATTQPRCLTSTPLPFPSRSNSQLVDQSTTLIVGNTTFPLLFPHNVIDAEGKIKTCAGYLMQKDFTTLLLNTDLSTDQKWRLYDAINSLGEYGKRFTINELPQTIPANTFSTTEQILEHSSAVITTNDSSYVLHLLSETEPNNIFFPTSDNTAWTDLIEQINLVQQEGAEATVNFTRVEAPFWQNLRDGKTVVLYGSISKELYQKLESLFACKPPYLMIQGIKHEIKGKIVLVLPKNYQLANVKNHYQITATLPDYKPILLKKGYKAKTIDRLLLFYTLANNYLPKITSQKFELPQSLTRLEKMLVALQEAEQNPGENCAENPIKQYYLSEYPPNSEIYAFLNVLAKLVFDNKISFLRSLLNAFCTAVGNFGINLANIFRKKESVKEAIPTKSKHFREEKFNALIEEMTSDNQTATNYFWRFLNVFHVQTLKKQLGINEKNIEKALAQLLAEQPEQKQKTIDKLQNKERIAFRANQNDKERLSPINKQLAKINKFLTTPNQITMTLIGPPGVGKTFLAKHLKDNEKYPVQLFNGFNKLGEWLDATSKDKIHVLLIDEFNLEPAEKWAFLHNLSQNPPQILYKGKTYQLDQQHKIIFTGNPYNDPARYKPDEPLLANTYALMFKKPKDHRIRIIIEPWFLQLNDKLDEEIKKHIIEIFIAAYHYEIFNVSIRDLEMLYLRLYQLCQEYPEENKICLTLIAVKHEFSYRKKNLSEIDKFIEKQTLKHTVDQESVRKIIASDILSRSEFPKRLGNYVVTTSYKPYINLLREALDIREKIINNPALPKGKNGLLLEGASGIGKTEIIASYLKYKGISFEQITAGSKNVAEILLDAFHSGRIVLLDELNLDPDLEQLLNQLMTGEDLEGKEAEHPGFFVFATQNPINYAGCSRVSPALLNRFQFVSVKIHTTEDLAYIAEEQGLTTQHASQLVRFTEQMTKSTENRHPTVSCNQRLFFVTLSRLTAIPQNLGFVGNKAN